MVRSGSACSKACFSDNDDTHPHAPLREQKFCSADVLHPDEGQRSCTESWARSSVCSGGGIVRGRSLVSKEVLPGDRPARLENWPLGKVLWLRTPSELFSTFGGIFRHSLLVLYQ